MPISAYCFFYSGTKPERSKSSSEYSEPESERDDIESSEQCARGHDTRVVDRGCYYGRAQVIRANRVDSWRTTYYYHCYAHYTHVYASGNRNILGVGIRDQKCKQGVAITKKKYLRTVRM